MATMSDEAANIQFIKAVETYPCLYDYTTSCHFKRHVTNKAWTAIGNETNLSMHQCKAKWKNLRTAFARSIKKPPPGKKIKDYYLKNCMQFVLPYMKPKSRTVNLPLATENESSNDKESEYGENDSGDEEELEYTSQNIKSIKRERENSSEADKCFIDYVECEKTTATDNSNPDLDFMKSLLPDLSKMNDYQKRQFKKQTLDVIDNILCDSPHYPKQPPSPALSKYSNT